MGYKTIASGIIVVFLFGIMAYPLPAEEKTAPQPETTTVSIVGRLTLEPSEKNEQLILHGKDAKTYQIQGELAEQLKSVLSDLGKDNLVSLSGDKDNSYSIFCATGYKADDKGKRIIEAKCIRYYSLKVTKINEARNSDEEMPPAERDIEEEQNARASFVNRAKFQPPPLISQLKGIISAINFRSPIKTIKVTFRDKNKKPVNKNFILSSGTYIAKKEPQSEGMMRVDIESLRKGQEVSVGYSRDELRRRSDALFITIIKE
ncbi:MAG: hypothetical protein AABY43_06835 [Candidatus Omnitrophota bacterium]